MSTPELKPCPFCGKQPTYWRSQQTEKEHVVCYCVHVHTSPEVWNTRHNPAESALNAARDALGEIEECANNAASNNNIGRVGTIAFILLRDKAEAALAQIDKALSPQQSKTT